MMKVAILSSYTTDFLADALLEECGKSGLDIELIPTPFGQYREQLVDPHSVTRTRGPDVIILALSGEELLRLGDDVVGLLHQAKEHFPGSFFLVHTGVKFEASPVPLLEWNRGDSESVRLARLNLLLHDLAITSTTLRIVDLDALVRAHGSSRILDARMRYLAKHPFSQEGNEWVTRQLVQALGALADKRRKCIVLDLDQTLWGGVLAEDGPGGLLLSEDGPGKAYQDFQKNLHQLRSTGVLLAICSKNDERMAIEVMSNHPFMVLRPEHFAAWRINWQDKPTNLMDLATELNIGIDSFVFVDDSPHERELMRQCLPMVAVPDFPADPADLPDFVSNMPDVAILGLTQADRQRADSYSQEKRRKDARAAFTSYDAFLKSLDMRLLVEPVNEYTVARAAQLTQRTNQFNLTTRRLTENDVRAMLERPDTLVLTASATDRFGDNGIVGLAIITFSQDIADLHTFLVSCRALGRQLETAFLGETLRLAKNRGARWCMADYIPTERNGVAAGFLATSGFIPHGSRFRFDMTTTIVTVPAIKAESIHGQNSY